MDLFGRILRDTLNTEGAVYYAIERDDNFLGISDAQSYFLPYDFFPEIEKELLKLASGLILELACGAGRIALHLQQTGYSVLATDHSPGALEVCKARGIRNTKSIDITNPKQLMFLEDKYELVVIFGNSLPVTGNAETLVELLNQLYNITTDNGIVIGDFRSPLPVEGQAHLDYHQQNREKGQPIGLIRMRIRYQNLIDDWMHFWLPTQEEFLACVEQTSWSVSMKGDPHTYFTLRKSQ